MDDKALFNVPAYKAPELTSTGEWFNSQPLRLSELKGEVVLVDFWTYSCINCLRTLPYVQGWYDAYKNDGFMVIGVHAPEFAFEKVPANVQRAIQDHKLTYPIVQDNDYAIWRAYSNHYWPAHYLIGKDGRVRREHFGEGGYDETEKAIRALLAEAGHDAMGAPTVRQPVAVPVAADQTPETYLGYERGERFANSNEFAADQPVAYTLAEDLADDEWSLGGSWKVGAMDTEAIDDDNKLRIKFSAKNVYLVMDGPKDAYATLMLDGKSVTSSRNGGQDVGEAGRVHLDGARLYRLVSLPTFTRGATLDISLPKGVTVNAFTFGD